MQPGIKVFCLLLVSLVLADAGASALARDVRAAKPEKAKEAVKDTAKTPKKASGASATNAKKTAAGFLKKAKLETELAKQEMEISKDLEAKAKLEAPGSDAAKKDMKDSEKALLAGTKAMAGAKEAVSEAKKAAAAAGVKGIKKSVSTPVVKKAEKKPADEMTEMERVAASLQTLSNLKSVFEKGGQGEKLEGQEIAEGAMTTELGKQDSAVWNTIMDMVKTTQEVKGKLKNAKSKDEKDALMKSVEEKLNAKAVDLGEFTKKVDETDKRQSEEYLLGLLMQHQGKWSSDQQIEVLKKFAKSLPVAKELLAHHDDSKPLALQLGDLMDKEKKDKTTASKAASMFLQLAASLRH